MDSKRWNELFAQYGNLTMSETLERMDKAERDFATAQAERDWALSTNGLTHGVYAELYALRAEAAALKADAERYRWLRDTASISVWESLLNVPANMTDAAIDAARKEGV